MVANGSSSQLLEPMRLIFMLFALVFDSLESTLGEDFEYFTSLLSRDGVMMEILSSSLLAGMRTSSRKDGSIAFL